MHRGPGGASSIPSSLIHSLIGQCKSDQVWNFATTRRPANDSASKICDQCAKYEALVDYCDNIVESGLLHREYSFFQLCCGNKEKSGHEKFLEFLKLFQIFS